MSEVKETDTSLKETDSSIMSCASCGIAEVDDIKLKECSACDLVRYCSDTCRDDHKSKHDEACKIRAAELRDELLFKQPEPRDCLICFLPLSIDQTKSAIFRCCSKTICIGCVVASRKASINPSCPFCRKLVPDTVEECEKLNMKRVKANDPVAMIRQGADECKKGNYDAAFELYAKAAELGHARAHYKLATIYQDGLVVDKDRRKKYTIWKRLQSEGIPSRGILLEESSFKTAILREQ